VDNHTLRKRDRKPCKAALMWNPQGSRKTGRPRNIWQRSTLTESGKRSWRELRPIARDRRKWKGLTTYIPNGMTDFIIIIIIIIIIISCHRFSFFPDTFPLEPVVNPTTQASSLSL
jgi:hypothetical protein